MHAFDERRGLQQRRIGGGPDRTRDGNGDWESAPQKATE